MGKVRVLGAACKLQVVAKDGTFVDIGEIDRFSARNLSENMKSNPLGETETNSWVRYEGWDLDFEGGKVNWHLANLVLAQDNRTRANLRSPLFRVVDKLTHLDGEVEEWVYGDVTLHMYNFDAGDSASELREKIQGFAPYRDQGVNSTTLVKTALTSWVAIVNNIVSKMTA